MVLWVVLWANFIARDLFKKGDLKDYKILARSGEEKKRSYVYGRYFYELLSLAKNRMPPEAFYDFAGIDDLSLESRRGIYYLYPCLKSENPVYMLVYEKPNFKKDGYYLYDGLDDKRFMLKRR